MKLHEVVEKVDPREKLKALRAAAQQRADLARAAEPANNNRLASSTSGGAGIASSPPGRGLG
jgi:hypothetical protein